MYELIPPDLKRCQCEITPAHGPFVLGPKPRRERCEAPPVFLAVEIRAGRDGLRGSMSLCLDCTKVMMENADLRSRVQLQPIQD